MKLAPGRVFLWLFRLVLSAIFIYAGVAKMRDPGAFAESIASFRLLPNRWIDPAAMTLPVFEILAGGLALTAGRWRRAGALGLVLLLLVFLAALGSALARGLSVDCGCFGADKFDVLAPSRNLWIAIGRDALLAVIAWVLYDAALKQGCREAAL